MMTSNPFQSCLDAADASGLARHLAATLKSLPAGTLPLQAGCGQGGLVDDHDIATTILSTRQAAEQVSARVGVFFTEVVGGCNCNDDPVEVNAYCVIEVIIDRASGQVRISPAVD
jgi:hypothetical protein